MIFTITTPKGSTIEMPEDTEIAITIDGIKYIIKITKDNGNI